MTKRIVSLLMALALLCTCVAAFAEQVDAVDNPLNTYTYWEPNWPIVPEGETLTIKVATQVNSAYYQEPEKTWFWVWAEKATGIDFEVTQITGEALTEQKNLMFAADNLPDVMLAMGLSTGEIMRYGVGEKQLKDLSAYITEENMPYLSMWFEKYPMMKTLATTPDGAIYSLPFTNLNSDYIGSQQTIIYNQNWLREVYPELPANHSTREEYYAYAEAAGKVLPRTLDEFTALLYKFKELHPDATPLGGIAENSNPMAYLLNAFGYLGSDHLGYGYEAALRNGEVVLPAIDDTFIEFLKLMNQYYNDGIIAKDFFTADKLLVTTQMTDNQCGIMPKGNAYGELPDAKDYHQWDAMYPLTSQWNEQPQVRESSRYNVGGACLSAKVEEEKIGAILNFLDFFYSDLGIYYTWCGPINQSPDTLGMVEGFYYNLEKGSKIFPDVVKGDYENSIAYVCGIGFGNSSAFGNRSHSITDESYSTMMETLQHLQGTPDEKINRVKLAYDHGDNYGRICSEIRVLPYVKDGFPWITYYSAEDQEVIDEVTLLLNDYVTAEVSKFITGANEINEENFQNFVKTCKAYGADDLVEIWKRAYEAYQAAL